MWECEWEKGRISQAYSLKDLPHYTAFLPTADREPVLKERDGPLARWIRWWVLAANELSWARQENSGMVKFHSRVDIIKPQPLISALSPRLPQSSHPKAHIINLYSEANLDTKLHFHAVYVPLYKLRAHILTCFQECCSVRSNISLICHKQ